MIRKFFRKVLARPPKLAGLKMGRAGEAWIAYLYKRKGCKIVATNYALYGKKQFGEFDVICLDGRRLIMVEVKTRENENFMNIEETVDWRKQGKLRRMAKLYLLENPEFDDFDLQIDVAGVLMDTVDNSVKSVKIIENAIEDSV